MHSKFIGAIKCQGRSINAMGQPNSVQVDMPRTATQTYSSCVSISLFYCGSTPSSEGYKVVETLNWIHLAVDVVVSIPKRGIGSSDRIASGAEEVCPNVCC
jgi:hypothetical protein